MLRTLTITTAKRQTNEDLAYWRSRPAAERLAAVEQLRLQHEGLSEHPDAQPRLQRVCRVTQRTPR
ncbi:hypothetical protein [Roseateles saccharophilus]|uniref:hypothetical protein n=1 Tax=Roseateles saccharophilus TaxID=304 RepID=UPI001042B7CE|nr:hypothetical protein [Roseateles saccharophilus]MDG0832370.1 hypothetical protein [Roseateles saccharophilus]